VAVAVLATALGLLLLLWGAASGDPLVGAPTGDVAELPVAEEPPVLPEEPPPPEDPLPVEDGEPEPVEMSLDWLVVLGLAAALLLVGLLVRALLRRQDDEVETVHLDPELDILVEATSVPSGAAALVEGEPRNAVVACWVAVEDGVARAGLDRSPAETSLDLARRVLGTWEVDEAAVETLAGLYREARFSRHTVNEAQRTRAVAALDRINADLRDAAARRRAAEAREAADHAPVSSSGPGDDPTAGPR
jgi:hypothetical protein